MKSFARMTKLNNVVGRSKYICNEERQEEIVCMYQSTCMNTISWSDVARYERSHRKSEAKNNEARELILPLPNNCVKLPTDQLDDFISDMIAAAVPELDVDANPMELAVHWNHDRSNLHAHLIFSERRYTGEVTYWDRDIYQTQDGRVARSKKERAVDSDGNFLPPIHRKGDIKSDGFSAKDPVFKSRSFTKTVADRLDAFFSRQKWIHLEKTQPWHIHERHQGKGPKADMIKGINARIKEFNADVDFLLDHKFISTAAAVDMKKRGLNQLRANEYPRVELDWFRSVGARLKVSELLQSRRDAARQPQQRTQPTPEPRGRSYWDDPRGW